MGLVRGEVSHNSPEETTMTTAVIFDLFETLISEAGLRPTRASSLAACLGLDEQAYRREWKKRRRSVVTGDISFRDALADISRCLAGHVDIETIHRIRQTRILEKSAACARIDADVIALTGALARRGIRLGVLSNGFEEDMVGWSHCPLAPQFNCAVFSCAERLAKPDPEIYLRAVHRLGVQPAAALYIGDGADDELGGADAAGLRVARAAWYVQQPPQRTTWAELTGPRDVLTLLVAQQHEV